MGQSEQKKEENMETVKHKTRYRFEQSAGGPGAVHKLYVYDEVSAQGKFNWNTWEYEDSETSAKYFRDQLDAIPNGETIELHVNSVGGEVGEGVTIYNLLRQKAGGGSRIIGYVDGMAYSVAMNIVMACDEIHMGLGTSMFLHNPWTVAKGNADQLRSMADQLDELSEASVQLYMSRASGITEDELRQMMKKETMLAPDKCLQYGFCDIVGEGKKEDAPENSDDDPDNDPDEVSDDDKGSDDDTDDEKQQIKELRQQLYRQRQINQMLTGLKRPGMQRTFAKALEKFANK